MDRLAHILNRQGIEMAKKLLDKDRVFVPPFKREYIDQIINIICDHFGADQEAVTNKSYRGAKEIIAKYVSIYFIYRHYHHLRQIDVASIFNFDRSTVVYALKKVEDYKQFDKHIAEDIEKINKKIKSMYLKKRR
jgi:chromosomal replication initiation ATPase DnaA